MSSTTLSVVEVVTEPTVTEQFSEARVYLRLAECMAHGAAASMVMVGCELTRLHKLYGVRAGRRPANYQPCVVIRWPDLIREQLGFSDEKARRCMDLADAVKKSLPELRPIMETLLATPLGELPMLERQRFLEKITRALPDSSTRQLMLDLGILREPKKVGGARPGAATLAAGVLTGDALAAEAREALAQWLADGTRALLTDNLCAHLSCDEVRTVHRALADLVTAFHRGIRGQLKGGSR